MCLTIFTELLLITDGMVAAKKSQVQRVAKARRAHRGPGLKADEGDGVPDPVHQTVIAAHLTLAILHVHLHPLRSLIQHTIPTIAPHNNTRLMKQNSIYSKKYSKMGGIGTLFKFYVDFYRCSYSN